MSISISGDGSITGVSTSYTFDKSVSIAGTVSYEDVTSIDAVGIITAQTGIHIDDSIVHLGDTNTKIRFPAADTVTVETAGSERIRVASNGNITIGTASNPGGKLFFESSSGSAQCIRSGGTNNQNLLFGTASTEYLRITSAGQVRIANTNLNTNSSADDLIVGTTSSNRGISIFSATDGTGNIFFGDTDTSGTGNRMGTITYDHSGNYMRFSTNGNNERLRITSAGDMGLGVTDATILDDSGFRELMIGGATEGAAIHLQDADGNVQFGAFTSDASNAAFIRTVTNHPIVFRTNNTERLRIDSSGRLLVGTTSARTDVSTTAQMQLEGISQATSTFSIVRNSNDAGRPTFVFGKTRGTSAGAVTAVSNNDLLGVIEFLGSDGTDLNRAAFITAEVDGTPGTDDMPGRLTFSTSQDGTNSPTERMRIHHTGQTIVRGTSTNGVLNVDTSQGAASNINLMVGGYSSSTIGSSTACIVVLSNGDVKNTNNIYGSLSDVKLKENIVDASSQWDDIKSLKVRNYNFKEETGHQTHTQLGVIAQEIETVSSGLVSESPDRDDEGNDLGTVTKNVKYSVLYMKAVKALQEAMARIETLESKVASLENP